MLNFTSIMASPLFASNRITQLNIETLSKILSITGKKKELPEVNNKSKVG